MDGTSEAISNPQHWAPFYCSECDRSYGADHWGIVGVFDEPGWYDESIGTCAPRATGVYARLRVWVRAAIALAAEAPVALTSRGDLS